MDMFDCHEVFARIIKIENRDKYEDILHLLPSSTYTCHTVNLNDKSKYEKALSFCCDYLFSKHSIYNVDIFGGLLFTLKNKPVTIFYNDKRPSTEYILVIDLDRCVKIMKLYKSDNSLYIIGCTLALFTIGFLTYKYY